MNLDFILDTAMKSLKASIIITDINGYISFANISTEKMWQYTNSELVGMQISKIFVFSEDTKDHVDFYKNLCDEVLAEKDCIKEFHGIKKDMNKFSVEISIYPLKSDKNQIESFLIISEDITEKKKLIEDLSSRNIELKQALDNLKATQVSLVQEDKMASIGQLSAGIAHEINNPLGFVISNFETLKKYVKNLKKIIELYRKEMDKLPIDNLKVIKEEEKHCKLDFIMDDVEELFKDTEDGIERVRKIVLAMRTFAHENENVNYDQYDMNEGINNTLVIVKNEVKYTANVELGLKEIPSIEAKGNEINQVLLNLIVNASHAIKDKKFNEKGFGLIKISTESDEGFIYCSIEDNGVGIKEENLTKIFEPFFTTKPIGKGTGLGLSIAYDIIKNKHKGDLIVKSKFKIGTKITIKLPIKQNM